MKEFLVKANSKLLIFISVFLTIYCVVDEGNILLSMSSNFTLQNAKSKTNNKNYYTIPLKVGTPEIEYEVQVDTSSATTWLPSNQCKNCILAHRLYDPEESRTSSPTNLHIEIEDEDGNVEGYQISDDIKLGDYKLKQFGFVQVTKVADDFRDHYQGKLGLGYENHHLKDEEFNFLEKLKKNNLIKKKVFTINTINEKKGMLFIGDTPGKEYNSFCNVTHTDDLDDMYKESWVCQLTHVGIFERNKGIFNKIKYYDELNNNRLVSFDSGYDYIAVPISEKEQINKLLDKAQLECEEKQKNQSYKKKEEKLRKRIREEEITITCKADMQTIKKKELVLSFILQGYSYSLPLEHLFIEKQNKNEVEMLIKYIDDKNAIWTFGYPFMNQFLMIFNMEENHVGIKKLKKTALPIVNMNSKDWQKYALKEDSSTTSSTFKIIGYITLILVVLAIIFFIVHSIKKRNNDSSIIESNKESRNLIV